MNFSDSDLADLAERIDGRLNGLVLQGVANGSGGRLPADAGRKLAQVALEWFAVHQANQR